MDELTKHRDELAAKMHAKVAELLSDADPREVERFVSKYSITLPVGVKNDAS